MHVLQFLNQICLPNLTIIPFTYFMFSGKNFAKSFNKMRHLINILRIFIRRWKCPY